MCEVEDFAPIAGCLGIAFLLQIDEINYELEKRQGGYGRGGRMKIEKDKINIIGNIKYIIPYALWTGLMWLTLIILFYVIGIPFGIGAYPGL